MTDKHTPGPWRWTDGENDIDIATYKSPGYYCNPQLVAGKNTDIIGCDEYWTIGPVCAEKAEQVANAKLIAAAPVTLDAARAMLAVLERAETHFRILPPSMDEPDSVMAQMVAAIAQALAAGITAEPFTTAQACNGVAP